MRVLYAAIPPRDAYLARALSEAGHVVETAMDLTDLLFAAGGGFDAVLLEAERVDEAVVARLRSASGRALTLLVVDGATTSERTRALQAGADACFVRPTPFMELEARLLALMRLSHAGDDARDLTLDASSRTVRLGGRQLVLPLREFALLDYLHARAGEVVGSDQLVDSVWSAADDAGPERLRSTLTRLRRRLNAAFGTPVIETVRGHGYRAPAKMKQSSST